MIMDLRRGSGAALLTAFLAWPASAHAQAMPAGIDISLARIAAALLFCCLLALAIALVLKKFGAGRIPALPGLGRGRGKISVLEARRLSPHADLCRFVSGEREYLVLLSPGGATLLRDVDASSAATAPAGEPT